MFPLGELDKNQLAGLAQLSFDLAMRGLLLLTQLWYS
jgi:hypothetical protein